MPLKINQTQSPYSNDQIIAYLRTIKFLPESASSQQQHVDANDFISNFNPSLDNLDRLMRCHLIAFPFENLSTHYTASKKVHVGSQEVFQRLVTARKGFGSWCFGHNTLLKGILQGLKYRVYATAGRVNAAPPENSTPILSVLVHLVLIVQLSTTETPYLVDVGFGGIFGSSGLVHPILLSHGTVVPGSAPPEEHQIIIGPHPSTAIATPTTAIDYPRHWMLMVRESPREEDWRALYQFSLDCEFFEEDAEFHSFGVSNMVDHPITTRVICIKFFEVEDGSGKVGRLSVAGEGNKIVKRIGVTSEVVCTFKTELERVKALREFCGVLLDDEDVQYIRGSVAALPLE